MHRRQRIAVLLEMGRLVVRNPRVAYPLLTVLSRTCAEKWAAVAMPKFIRENARAKTFR
jgi:hypothetical protein